MNTTTDNTWEQPAEAPTRKPFYKRWWFITIAVILALIVAFAAWFVYDAKQQANAINTAVEGCKQDVINHAKYPGGAKIVTFRVELGEKVNANQSVWVGGTADFPNGFGTPVRMGWTCNNVLVFPDGDYEIGDVNVSEVLTP